MDSGYRRDERLWKSPGFFLKDMEKQFPTGFTVIPLAGLKDYFDDYVIAWSPAEADKRPEIGQLAKHLAGK